MMTNNAILMYIKIDKNVNKRPKRGVAYYNFKKCENAKLKVEIVNTMVTLDHKTYCINFSF